MADEDLDFTADLEKALSGGEAQPQAGQPDKVEAPVKDAAFPRSEDMPKREYVREGRRFVAKDADGKEIKESEVAPTKDAVVAEGAAPKVEPPVKSWKPLWYKEEYGKWETLAEPFRNALREQERNAAQAIEKHSTTVKAWEPISKMLEPHRQELAASGVTEQQYVTNLVNADKYLRTNPVEALNFLARQYCNTDLVGVVDWMTQNGVEPQKVDPIKQELDALKARLTNYEKSGQDAAANAQRAALETQIQDWAKDKPHFEDVRELMSSLARAPINKGASLDDLYENALNAHPQLRQRIQEDKRRAELDRARVAGATSPRGGATNGSARTKSTLSLEEEIGQLYDSGV